MRALLTFLSVSGVQVVHLPRWWPANTREKSALSIKLLCAAWLASTLSGAAQPQPIAPVQRPQDPAQVQPQPAIRLFGPNLVAPGQIQIQAGPAVRVGWAALTNTNNTVVIQNVTNRPVTSAIRLQNGDTLQGKLKGMNGSQVRWENPNIHPVLELSASNVSRIRLAPAPTQAKARGNCLVRLLNGDQFHGKLLSMDRDKLVLETWYAGQLTFPRAQVRWLRSSQEGAAVFQGPTGLEGWTISASAELADEKVPAWGYSRGTFFSRRAGGIARDVKLPDRAAIDFDLAWRQYLQLTVTIYTDSLQVYRLPGSMIFGGGFVNTSPPVSQPGSGFYAIHLNQGGAYLMTVRKDGSITTSGTATIAGLDQKGRAHISVRVDKMQRTISLLIDGKLVKTWEEGGEFAGHGTGIRLVQQGLAPINISHLTVSPWDGILEQAVEPGAPSNTNDFVLLKNSDSFSASLQQIGQGSLALQTSFGPLKVPLERVTEVTLASRRAVPPAPLPGSVRAYFADHDGSVILKIEQWDEQKVVARSPLFGRAEFNPAAFSLLEFTAQ